MSVNASFEYQTKSDSSFFMRPDLSPSFLELGN